MLFQFYSSLHHAPKHGFNHYDAVNRIKICLKTVLPFIVEHNIEGALISVKGNLRYVYQTDCPCCCKHLWIIRVDNCLTNDPISWLWSREVSIQCIKTIWVWCSFSQLLVVEDHWDPAWHPIWPSWTYRFYILHTVMGSGLMGAAILRYDKLQPQKATIWSLSKSDMCW